MKQKIYILGLISTMIMSLGAIFKVNHWPAAGIMLITGSLLLILFFIPAALMNSYKAEGNNQNRILYIVTYITGFVVFTAMLFKIMHWPYAGIGLLIALPFPYIVFLPVFLIVTSKNRNFSIYNTVFVLILLALNSVFSALLALNVSKSTIIDSYNISRDYNRVESAMAGLPVTGGQSAVNAKIDEVLKIVNNYQDLILNNQKITREQWKTDPGNLQFPESPNIPMVVLANSGESYPGDRLQAALKELYELIEKGKGYEHAANGLPAILGLAEKPGMKPDWTIRHVAGNNLAWVLIYLDGLEANLKMIKASAL
jgi:hypothetical protein